MRIEIYNESDTPERINWHGQDSYLWDGSVIAPGTMRRVELTPQRPGLYFYHSDLIATTRLDAGLYSGLVGGLLVEPQEGSDLWGVGPDREYVAVLKEHEPFIHRTARGYEVAYDSLTINGLLVRDATPPSSDIGGSVLLQVLNASATESHSLELPGRAFEVLALDGNPVPRPVTVTRLYLGPGERVAARVAEAQGAIGHELYPGWELRNSAVEPWDYTRFGTGGVARPEATLKVVLTRHQAARSGFNRWCINGSSFSVHHPRPLFRLRYGLRYRLTINNTSDEIIPLHLQRHQLEITSVDGHPTAGVLKDVVSVGPCQNMEVDFVANSPGRALFYCTRQLHRDFGLMALLDYM